VYYIYLHRGTVLRQEMKMTDAALRTYTVIYGHSGRYGREYKTAFEASRYAANCADEIEAHDEEHAKEVISAAMVDVGFGAPDDFHFHGDRVDVIWAKEEEQ
jgi:hypothetical protein